MAPEVGHGRVGPDPPSLLLVLVQVLRDRSTRQLRNGQLQGSGHIVRTGKCVRQTLPFVAEVKQSGPKCQALAPPEQLLCLVRGERVTVEAKSHVGRDRTGHDHARYVLHDSWTFVVLGLRPQ